MQRIIRKIIARKCVEGRRPLVATAMEVYEECGLPLKEQLAVAEALPKIKIGQTSNSYYYELKDIEEW